MGIGMGRVQTLSAVLVLTLMWACNESPTPEFIVDAEADGGPSLEVLGSEVACVPNCAGRDCGDDGCGETCGQCSPLLQSCTAEGQCAAFSCQTSIDCPGTLVCADTLGECVVCVGSEDCPDGDECGPDYLCHSQHPCESDKDCKEYGLLCNKDLGICTECVKTSHCPPLQFCLTGFCIDAVCPPGELSCDGEVVQVCREDGSGREAVQSCQSESYCSEGVCVEYACVAGAFWCDGETAYECAEDGKVVAEQTDCTAQEATCEDGACVPLLCDPMETWCTGDFATAACDPTGLQVTEMPCPAEHYCDEGTCHPTVCEPGAVYCDGEVYKVCDAKGASVQYVEDCGAKEQHCFSGSCIDTACGPGTDFCIDGKTIGQCAGDGMSFASKACLPEHFCFEGVCFPWVCEPGNSFCEGNTAVVCNALGSAPQESVECGDKVCADGTCVDCPQQCEGKSCGDDGCGSSCGNCAAGMPCVAGQCAECSDGNAVDWDGCTNDGVIAEFQVNTTTAGKQYGTSVDSWSDGRFAVAWSGAGEGVADGVFLRRFAADGAADGDDIWVDEAGTGSRTQARVRTSSSGNFIVVWRRGQVYSRLFAQDNAPLTGVVQVSGNEGPGTHTEPTVDFFADGSHVIMWHRNNSIYAQRFLPSGQKTGSYFVVSQGTGRVPSVRVLSSGETVATYHRYADGSGNGIFARYFDASFTPHDDQYLVNQTTNKNQEVASLGLLPGDVLVAIWSSDQQDGSATGVFGQRFGPDGTKVGAEFQANTFTAGAQGALWSANNKVQEYRRTALATFADGLWVVVWESHNQTSGSEWDVFGQRFNADGTHSGNEFAINTFVAGVQDTCSVATLPAHGIVVTWASAGQDGSGYGVFAQRFDGQGNRLIH